MNLLKSPLRKISPLEDWSPREIALFESGICCKGKQFYEISKLIETKNTKQVVQFYYFWKMSSHYKIWKELGKNTQKSINIIHSKLHKKIGKEFQKFQNKFYNKPNKIKSNNAFSENKENKENQQNGDEQQILINDDNINKNNINISPINHMNYPFDVQQQQQQQNYYHPSYFHNNTASGGWYGAANTHQQYQQHQQPFNTIDNGIIKESTPTNYNPNDLNSNAQYIDLTETASTGSKSPDNDVVLDSNINNNDIIINNENDDLLNLTKKKKKKDIDDDSMTITNLSLNE